MALAGLVKTSVVDKIDLKSAKQEFATADALRAALEKLPAQ